MAEPNRGDTIVVITESDERQRQLRAVLRAETSTTITALSLDADFETRLDSRSTARDGVEGIPDRSANAADRADTTELSLDPDGIVIGLDRPEGIRTTLDRLADEVSSVPTIVVPEHGSEHTATAALRAGASDYVPDDEELRDRLLDAVRSTTGNEQAPQPDGKFHRILANELPDEAYLLSETGTYLEAKLRPGAKQSYTLSTDELVGRRLSEVFPEPTATELQACLDRAIQAGDVQSVEYEAMTADGMRRYEGRVVPVDEPIDGERAVVWLARDITERAQRVRKLQSRRDRLETLNRINAVVREVIETVVEAPTRDAIEREVCTQLVDSELYCGSWIAELTADQQLTYRTGFGGAETFLNSVRELSADRQPPLQQAVSTGEVQTTNGLPTADSISEPLRTAAAADGVESLIAVPISHENATYGVLTVLASRDDAFGDCEQAEFRLLGETIGFVIQAVKNQQLLFADTVIELEFQIHGSDTFSFELSETYDCTCTLEWAGTTANGRSFQYVTIDGLDYETVMEEASASDSVEACRLIHDGAHRCTIELQLSNSGIRTLANHGATIREVTVEDGGGSLLVEVSQDVDIREIAEALTDVYENTDLIARREVDRPVRTAAERRTRILDELTERQLTTLRHAYYSGFFDWPRESTGEEIAEAMDVSPPTMHQHLRKALKTVFGEFFEDDNRIE